MDIKKFGSLALGCALLGMASCASDEPSVKVPESTQGDVFATLTLSLPTTRSATDETGETNSDANPDYEVGFDYENNVKSVYVLLASKDEDGPWVYAGSSYQNNLTNMGLKDNKIVYDLTFESTELAKAIAPEVKGESVELYVFAYCNPTNDLLTELNKLKDDAAKSDEAITLTDFFNGKETLVDDSGALLWEENEFLMTNAKISGPVTVDDYTTLVETYGKENGEHLNLGIVEVERAVSRFDFRDYTYRGNNGIEYALNTYPVHLSSSQDSEIVALVQLEGMSLVNMAKEFYYLPRVSDTGLDTDFTLCGTETPKNYVVSPNAEAKQVENAGMTLSATNYFYSLYNEGTVSPQTFDYTLFSSLNQQDNWTGDVKYKFWRYCTENTIPGVEYQTEGITTGIYFKGKIVASAEPVNPENWTDNTSVAAKIAWAMQEGEILYYFNEDNTNTLYAGVKDLIRVAQKNPVSKLHAACVEAFGDIDAVDFNIATVDNLENSVEGIGLYRPVKVGDEWVYNVYYFYKNRHNDNGNNNAMGPMEFATVRNNIYKLFVSNIRMFGHPGDTPDDPDPEDPDDPDETEKVYFDVQLQVLPWVVRVNDITF